MRIYLEFSLSRAQTFDLGRYPKGERRERVFPRAGVVKIYCHIHSDMAATILIFDHRLYATPTIALAPLFILWLGIGIWSKVLVVIFLVLFPVTINTEAGLRTTSERLIEMLRSFGASPRQIFFKVSLPSAVPFILAGLKLGIGRGLIGVVVAELFGSRAGLGRLIAQSADAFNMPELFAGVIVLAVAGIALTAGFGWLENRLVPWTKD